MNDARIGAGLIAVSAMAKVKLVPLRKNLAFQLLTSVMFALGWVIIGNNVNSEIQNPYYAQAVQLSIVLIVFGAGLNRHLFDKKKPGNTGAMLMFMGGWLLMNLMYSLDAGPLQESKIQLAVGSAVVLAGVMLNRRAEVKKETMAMILGPLAFVGGWVVIAQNFKELTDPVVI